MARIYKWENDKGVRFRLVINDIADMDYNPTTAIEQIITFYSDRNLKNNFLKHKYTKNKKEKNKFRTQIKAL